MTTLLMLAAISQVRPGEDAFDRRKHVTVVAPPEFIPASQYEVGHLPERIFRGPAYETIGYKVTDAGGVRTLEYSLRNILSGQSRDVFTVRVRFLSNMGAPPEGEQLVKGDPCYVQDGRGAKQWVYVESAGQATFTSRFSLKTPHYAPTTPDTMVSAEGVGKAIIRERGDGKFDVVLTTYLFHKGNRRDYYMLSGTLKP